MLTTQIDMRNGTGLRLGILPIVCMRTLQRTRADKINFKRCASEENYRGEVDRLYLNYSRAANMERFDEQIRNVAAACGDIAPTSNNFSHEVSENIPFLNSESKPSLSPSPRLEECNINNQDSSPKSQHGQDLHEEIMQPFTDDINMSHFSDNAVRINAEMVLDNNIIYTSGISAINSDEDNLEEGEVKIKSLKSSSFKLKSNILPISNRSSVIDNYKSSTIQNLPTIHVPTTLLNSPEFLESSRTESVLHPLKVPDVANNCKSAQRNGNALPVLEESHVDVTCKPISTETAFIPILDETDPDQYPNPVCVSPGRCEEEVKSDPCIEASQLQGGLTRDCVKIQDASKLEHLSGESDRELMTQEYNQAPRETEKTSREQEYNKAPLETENSSTREDNSDPFAYFKSLNLCKRTVSSCSSSRKSKLYKATWQPVVKLKRLSRTLLSETVKQKSMPSLGIRQNEPEKSTLSPGILSQNSSENKQSSVNLAPALIANWASHNMMNLIDQVMNKTDDAMNNVNHVLNKTDSSLESNTRVTALDPSRENISADAASRRKSTGSRSKRRSAKKAFEKLQKLRIFKEDDDDTDILVCDVAVNAKGDPDYGDPELLMMYEDSGATTETQVKSLIRSTQNRLRAKRQLKRSRETKQSAERPSNQSRETRQPSKRLSNQSRETRQPAKRPSNQSRETRQPSKRLSNQSRETRQPSKRLSNQSRETRQHAKRPSNQSRETRQHAKRPSNQSRETRQPAKRPSSNQSRETRQPAVSPHLMNLIDQVMNKTDDAMNNVSTETRQPAKRHKPYSSITRYQGIRKKKKTDFACTVCTTYYHHETALKRHILMKHGKLPENVPIIPCNKCTEVFFTRDQLRRHNTSVHRTVVKTSSWCSECDWYFVNDGILRRHNHVKHGILPENATLLQCTICTKEVYSEDEMTRHQLRFHPKKFGQDMHECDICQQKFRVKGQMLRHKRILHFEYRKCVCEVCGQVFDDKIKLGSHQDNHKKRFKCEICQTLWSTSYNLNTHMRCHTGERPHKCEVCQQEFSRKDNLNLHLKLKHNDVPRYKCKKCDQKFKTSREKVEHNREEHIKKKKTKTLECKICGEMLTKEQIEPHDRFHKEGRFMQCEQCKKHVKLTFDRYKYNIPDKDDNTIVRVVCHDCFEEHAKEVKPEDYNVFRLGCKVKLYCQYCKCCSDSLRKLRMHEDTCLNKLNHQSRIIDVVCEETSSLHETYKK